MGRVRNLLLKVLLVLMVAGCQTTESLSPREAEQLSVELQTVPFAPPPRDINDIIRLLDDQPSRNLPEIARNIEIANSLPPKNAGPDQRALFFLKRAKAAMDLGKEKQSLDDIRDAARFVRQAKKMPQKVRGRIEYLHAFQEFAFGNYKKAIGIRESSKRGDGSDMVRFSDLTRMYALGGDMEAAKEQARKAHEFYNKIRQRIPSDRQEFFLAALASIDGKLAYTFGKWEEAEINFRKFLSLSKRDSFRARGALAKSLVQQGKLTEAEFWARENLVEALQQFGTLHMASIGRMSELAFILNAQRRHEEAGLLIERAVEFAEKSGLPGESVVSVLARFSYAETLVALGKWEKALHEFMRLENNLKNNPVLFENLIRRSPSYPVALIRLGRIDHALSLLQDLRAKDIGIFGKSHYWTALKGGVIGVALAEKGDTAGALLEFEASVPILIANRFRKNSEASDTPRGSDHHEFIFLRYIELLSKVGTEESKSRAFELADTIRGRAVQEALSSSAARASTGQSGLSDLVRREQDAKYQLSALLGLLVTSASVSQDQRDQSAINSLQAKIKNLTKLRDDLRERIRKEFPDYADLSNPSPLGIKETQRFLKPDQALISILPSERGTFIWAVPNSGEAVFHHSGLDKSEIANSVKKLRAALDPKNVRTLGDIPNFDVDEAHELFSRLLAPVSKGWVESKNLLIVSDGVLGQVPLSLLPVRKAAMPESERLLFSAYRTVPWLSRSHAVTVVPSVMSLRALGDNWSVTGERRPFIGIGDPFFTRLQQQEGAQNTKKLASRGFSLRKVSGARAVNSDDLRLLPRLPDTRPEIEKIAAVLGADIRKDVYLGERASEDLIKSLDLTPYRVISFATHGLIPGDIDGLSQPALALSSPKVTGGKEDGLLTMAEILRLRLNADWAVLSACNTAAASGKGTEAISGLGRAFFYAGARALLVSHWPVHSGATTELMTSLFNFQAKSQGVGRAEILRLAQNFMIDDGVDRTPEGQESFSYAHPIFWAPFTLVGDGGGGMPKRP